MHVAAHIMIILDSATRAWLIDFRHKVIQPCGLKSLLRNFMADNKILLRNTRGHSRKW